MMGVQDNTQVYVPPFAIAGASDTQALTLTIERYGDPGDNVPGSVSAVYDFHFDQDGVTIDENHTFTVTMSFQLPQGMSQQDFEDTLEIAYFDAGKQAWLTDGIANVRINWANSTVMFEVSHLTRFVAFAHIKFSNITINVEKAKISWDHGDIHLNGKLYLPEGFWMDNLDRAGSAVITLAGVEVADQSVEFEIKGKKGDKWEYKDKKNVNGTIKEFKADWREGKFDYHGDDGFHIRTHSIGGEETTLCIHTRHVSGAFTVAINGTTIAYDEERNITTDIEYEPQKKDNSRVHFTLPFQLTPEMPIEVSGAIELTINVADYYKGGYAKFKLKSIFDSGLFPQGAGSLPDTLAYVISLGDGVDMISGSDLISSWRKKDHKHWEYK
ncbi:MAG: hypothetical protein JRI32_02955 [Deltaproteobacteria bacterium]|nr:hypothetical protein [Deltaproteobacteria bacterium]